MDIDVDAQISAIVEPILHKRFSRTKTAIEAFKLGREGVIMLMDLLGKTKLRLEAIEKAWVATDPSFKSKLQDQYRELHDVLNVGLQQG
jgi:hypothetical protein